MCGRFTLHHSVEEVAERFGAADILYADAPRYNIAPSQAVAAVVADNVSARRLVSLKWGLVPSWANDPTIGNRLLNAKGETLAEKPSFKQALVNRRCLIPADGFYEWRKSPGGSQPFHIRRRDGGLFAFAGLWEE